MDQILPKPCMACPYRKDVPSGIWSTEEYEKLIAYDRPTGEQPFEPFACHASPDHLCHGWAVCHSNRGHANDLLALRLTMIQSDDPILIPDPSIPLFESGTEAADHGKKRIGNPDRRAKAMIKRLLSRYSRLRKR